MNKTDSNSACCGIRRPIRKWLIGRKLRKLKLDDSQKEKLDQLFVSASSASKGRVYAKNELQQWIGVMMDEGDFNCMQVTELIRTSAEQYAEHATEFVTAFGEFYQGLEQWQQAQLQSMWQKRVHRASACCH